MLRGQEPDWRRLHWSLAERGSVGGCLPVLLRSLSAAADQHRKPWMVLWQQQQLR